MSSFLRLFFGIIFVCGALALIVFGILAFFDIGWAAGLYGAPAWFIFMMALIFGIPIGWVGVIILRSYEIA